MLCYSSYERNFLSIKHADTYRHAGGSLLLSNIMVVKRLRW